MALTDVNSNFPRIKLMKTTDTKSLIDYIKSRSGFVASDVVGITSELRDCILFFLGDGSPVKVDGIGIFSPSIKLDGAIQIRFRADKRLVEELNATHHLKKQITNRKNIGKSLDELKQIKEGNLTNNDSANTK